MRVNGHNIIPTHPDKLMYPADGITLEMVVEYYAEAAPYMMPYMRHRPLVMVRYPEGIGGEGFYQKEASTYFPKWLKRLSIQLVKGGVQHAVFPNAAADIAYLASQAALVFHTWTSAAAHLHMPDTVVFDLDPSDNDFAKVVAAARLLKPLVERQYQQIPQLVLTGSRGLHIIANIPVFQDFDTVRSQAHALAEEAARAQPGLVTTEVHKDERGNRVYIDVARNAYGQTHVVPYSLRALPGAPVATPISWEELADGLGPQTYTIHNIFERLSAAGNARRAS